MAGKAAGTGKGSGKGQAEKALPKGHDSLDSANKAVGLENCEPGCVAYKA